MKNAFDGYGDVALMTWIFELLTEYSMWYQHHSINLFAIFQETT